MQAQCSVNGAAIRGAMKSQQHSEDRPCQVSGQLSGAALSWRSLGMGAADSFSAFTRSGA